MPIYSYSAIYIRTLFTDHSDGPSYNVKYVSTAHLRCL